MAGSYGDGDPWRRPSRCGGHADPRDDDDEPEEGEIVPGDHSDVDTEEYYNRHSSLSDSDETVSDFNAAACSSVPATYDGDATSPSSSPSVVAANNKASSSSAPPPAAHACPICGKEFRSQKAVCGHMKVHQLAFGSQQKQGIRKDKGIKRDVVKVVAGWGGSGKRGCLGLGSKQAASPNAGSDQDQSMAIVVAEPKIVFQPMPLAFAPPNLSPVPMSSSTPIDQSSVSTASASPIQSPVPMASATTNGSGQSSTAHPMHNAAAMDTAVAAGPANPPPSDAVIHQHAAPAPAVQHAAPVVDNHAAPAPAAGRQNPNGYACPECNMWFPTHQGLGGHVAGHRNRENAAAAAGVVLGEDGAVVPCRRDAKPEKPHVCKVCGAVFLAGVQLGGHMRKHYAGPPIVPNKKPRLVQPLVALPPPALTLGLPANADEAASPAPAVEAALQHDDLVPTVERSTETAAGTATAGRVLLFGIDIAVRVQKPAAQEQEGPSETEGSASTEK